MRPKSSTVCFSTSGWLGREGIYTGEDALVRLKALQQRKKKADLPES